MHDLLQLPWHHLLLAAVVTFLAGLVQGTIGLGFSIVSVPILMLADPRFAPVPQLLIRVPMVIYMIRREHASLDLKGAIWTTIGRFPGTLAGIALLTVASQGMLDAVIAAIVLVGVLALSRGWSIRRTALNESVAGFFSGLGAFVSSIGGPPLALLYRNADGPTIRATLALIFGVGVGVTLGGRFLAGRITGLDFELAAFMLMPMALGLWASRFLLGRVEGAPLRRAILAVCAVAGGGLALRAIFSAIG
ncbi:MAG: sulfite exporter TauE/SafE family protein [Myxococcales bacterium]|nr:sulfite exporter TauE/SafE family protein [Myxococcales bacterium]